MKITVKNLFALCLLISAPLPLIVKIGSVGGIYLYEVITIICLIIIWYKKLFKRSITQIRINSNFKSLLKIGSAFIVIIFIGLFINFTINIINESIDAGLIIKIFLHVCITMLVLIGAFMGGFVLFNGKDDLLRVTWLLFFAFISTSVETLAKWIVTTGGIISRYNFDPPTGMGQGDTARSLILGFIITILLIAYHKGAKRFILILSILLIFLSIIIIQSRASYIIFIIQFLLIVLLIVKFSQTKFSSLFSILLMSALIVFFFIDTQIESFSSIFNNISDNIFNIKSTELSNKLLIFQDGKKMFISNPFFGVGWGNFGLHTTALIEISSTWYNVSTPHNGIIQLLSETGLIGTIPALWISILVLIFIYLQYKQQRDARLKLFFGFLLIIFLTVIASQFIVSSYLFPSPTLRSSVRISFYHWFLIGYAYSFIKCKSTKRLGNVTAL